MSRRTFLAALGSAAATWPLGARAEGRIPRIGWLALAPPDEDKPVFEAFESGLSAFGYIPGKTIEVEARFWDGGGQDKLAELARELVDREVDIIVTGGPGVIAAHGVTKTVPIVMNTFGSIDELIAMGMIASPARPGGNVTGETFFVPDLQVKRIELLKQVKSGMTRVGVLTLQGNPYDRFYPALEARVRALGLAAEKIELADPDDCDRALSSGPGASVGGLMVVDLPQFTVGSGPAAVAAAALRHGLPAAGPFSFARSGGLLSYAVDLIPLFRRAAFFVDRILKGTKPGDIPIEQATKFLTVVNLKTAQALGLDIPPTLLAAADEVIE